MNEIQLKRGKLASWEELNPILAPGEPACIFNTTTLLPIGLKLGDGVRHFNDLPYIGDEAGKYYTKDEIDVFITSLNSELLTKLTKPAMPITPGTLAVFGENNQITSSGTQLSEILDIPGAASTIIKNNLIRSRILVSDLEGKVGVSNVGSDKVNYLSNVSADLQSQLNNKEQIFTAEDAHTTLESLATFSRGGVYICSVGGNISSMPSFNWEEAQDQDLFNGKYITQINYLSHQKGYIQKYNLYFPRVRAFLQQIKESETYYQEVFNSVYLQISHGSVIVASNLDKPVMLIMIY